MNSVSESYKATPAVTHPKEMLEIIILPGFRRLAAQE